MSPQMFRAMEIVSAAYEEAMREHGILQQARTVIAATADQIMNRDILDPHSEPAYILTPDSRIQPLD